MFTVFEIPQAVPYVAAILAVVASIWGVSAFLARKRSDALAATSGQIGFTFSIKDEQQAPHLQTALFKKGHSRKFRNIMTGSAEGMRAVLFDYQCTIGRGRYAHTFKQTIAAYSKTGARLPIFEIRPRNLWQRIVGVKAINFDSHPEFMGRCYVASDDEMKTRQLLTVGLLSFLEGLAPSKKWRLEGEGETLLIYASEKRVKPQNLQAFLQETSSLAAQFFALGSCRA